MEDGYWNCELNDAAIARRDVKAATADLAMSGDFFKDYMAICDRLRIMAHPIIRQQQVENEQQREERKEKGIEQEDDDFEEDIDISIRGMKADHGTITAMACAMHAAHTLTTVSFWKAGLQPAQLAVLAKAICSSEVRCLRIEWNSLAKAKDGDEGASSGNEGKGGGGGGGECECFAAFVDENSPLEILWLRGNGIGPDTGRAIAARLKGNKGIAELNLTNNQIGDEGVVALAETLYLNRKLQRISLGYNGVTHRSVEQLLVPLSNSAVPAHLVEAVGEAIELDKEYLKTLKKSKGNKKKKKAGARAAPDDSTGMLEGPLAEGDDGTWTMPPNDVVSEIDLSGNPLGTQGVGKLADGLIANGCSLSWLGLSHIGASKSALQKAKERLQSKFESLQFGA